MCTIDYKQIVKKMKEKENSLSQTEITAIINGAPTFTVKCILIKNKSKKVIVNIRYIKRLFEKKIIIKQSIIEY